MRGGCGAGPLWRPSAADRGSPSQPVSRRGLAARANCIREWRGDTHEAIVTAAGIDGAEASILHNAWLGDERDRLARSRGSSPDQIAAAWASLERKALVADGEVIAAGHELRERIEVDTDRLTTLPWELLGESRSEWFAAAFEPPCERLLERVDLTAGPDYQPASRIR